MRKFLLVTFIGMAVAINLYGIVNEIIDTYFAVEEVNNYLEGVATIVYEE